MWSQPHSFVIAGHAVSLARYIRDLSIVLRNQHRHNHTQTPQLRGKLIVEASQFNGAHMWREEAIYDTQINLSKQSI